ncbi:MAG TPA: hypothetical protein VL137_15060 [Polyangiaceae bacterium]|nr:hypothetical protein [Polyangiaceae bacterium]
MCACAGSSGGGGGSTQPADAGTAAGAGQMPATDPALPVTMVGVDAGSTPVHDPSCTCTAPTTHHCEVLAVNCEADADCADGWTCEEISVNSGSSSCGVTSPAMGGQTPNASSSTGGTASSADSVTRPTVDGGTAEPADACVAMQPVTLPKQCMPPGYSYFAISGRVSVSESGAVSLGNTSTHGTGATDGTGTPTTQGNGGSAGSSPTNAAPAGHSKGCSFAGGVPASGGSSVWGLVLGFAAFGARRMRIRGANSPQKTGSSMS